MSRVFFFYVFFGEAISNVVASRAIYGISVNWSGQTSVVMSCQVTSSQTVNASENSYAFKSLEVKPTIITFLKLGD